MGSDILAGAGRFTQATEGIWGPMLGYIILIALSGLVVGALARLLLPGRDPMSIFETMLVGIAGSVIAGLIAYYLFDHKEGPGFLLSLLCAIGIVYAIRKIRERNATSLSSGQRY
jgi:uncharacterized membrane protein YeaQ/YmgE (transglycosylase-associated protein family)